MLNARAPSPSSVSVARTPAVERAVAPLPGASPRASRGAPSAGEARRAVTAATSGAATRLPHETRIQRAFGEHDVGSIDAYVGTRATRANLSMLGADGAASGERVAFSGRPSLHTAAHEAAHVVQQRRGARPRGGLGARGDIHERHADAVADRVVAGRSAAPLLDAVPRASSGAAAFGEAVQLHGFIGGPTTTKAESPLVTLVNAVDEYFPLNKANYPVHRGEPLNGWSWSDATDATSAINSTRTTKREAQIDGARQASPKRDGDITNMGYIGEFERSLCGREPTENAMYAGGHLIGLAILGYTAGVNSAGNLAPQEHSNFNNSSYKVFIETTALTPSSGLQRNNKKLKKNAHASAEDVPIKMKVELGYPLGYTKTWGELSDMKLIPEVTNERLSKNVVSFAARIPDQWEATLEIDNAADVASGWLFATKKVPKKQEPRVSPKPGALVRSKSNENFLATAPTMTCTAKRTAKFTQNVVRSGPSTRSTTAYRKQLPSVDNTVDLFKTNIKVDDVFLDMFTAPTPQQTFLDSFRLALDSKAPVFTLAFGSTTAFDTAFTPVFTEFDKLNKASTLPKPPQIKAPAPSKKPVKKPPPVKAPKLTTAQSQLLLLNFDTALEKVSTSTTNPRKRKFLRAMETLVDTVAQGNTKRRKVTTT
jgi:hypothetical protein